MKRTALVAWLTITLSIAYAQKIEKRNYNFKITSSENEVTRKPDKTYMKIDIRPSWKLITFYGKHGVEDDYLITDVFGDYGKNSISYEVIDDNKKRLYFTLTIDDRGEFSARLKGDITLTFDLRER